jgi:Zn ribbon nucleic-acid-binding protein
MTTPDRHSHTIRTTRKRKSDRIKTVECVDCGWQPVTVSREQQIQAAIRAHHEETLR